MLTHWLSYRERRPLREHFRMKSIRQSKLAKIDLVPAVTIQQSLVKSAIESELEWDQVEWKARKCCRPIEMISLFSGFEYLKVWILQCVTVEGRKRKNQRMFKRILFPFWLFLVLLGSSGFDCDRHRLGAQCLWSPHKHEFKRKKLKRKFEWPEGTKGSHEKSMNVLRAVSSIGILGACNDDPQSL